MIPKVLKLCIHPKSSKQGKAAHGLIVTNDKPCKLVIKLYAYTVYQQIANAFIVFLLLFFVENKTLPSDFSRKKWKMITCKRLLGNPSLARLRPNPPRPQRECIHCVQASKGCYEQTRTVTLTVLSSIEFFIPLKNC